MRKRHRNKPHPAPVSARTRAAEPAPRLEDWQKLDRKTINPIHDRLLGLVRAETGRSWKVANGERHLTRTGAYAYILRLTFSHSDRPEFRILRNGGGITADTVLRRDAEPAK